MSCLSVNEKCVVREYFNKIFEASSRPLSSVIALRDYVPGANERATARSRFADIIIIVIEEKHVLIYMYNKCIHSRVAESQKTR